MAMESAEIAMLKSRISNWYIWFPFLIVMKRNILIGGDS